jgi:small subunit ribosomal protein S20
VVDSCSIAWAVRRKACQREGWKGLANTKSAKKRIRVTLRRTLENRRRKTFVRTAIRKFERLLAAGDREGAREALRVVYRALDRAAQKGAIHRNKAARKKSRLAKKLVG